MNDLEKLELLKSEKPLSEEQKKAILTPGNIIVSAAAGSGKTFTMIKKIISKLLDGVPLRDLIILVYNESVASQLKEKLHNELFAQVLASSGELKEKLLSDLDSMPICHISTIHSFCKSLLHENFDIVGISPNFQVLDEAEHNTYKEKAIEIVFRKYFADIEDDVFLQLVEIFQKGRKEENLKDVIYRLHNLIDIQPNKDEFMLNVEKCLDTDLDKNCFVSHFFEYYKLIFNKYKEEFARLESSFKDINFPTLLDRLNECIAINDKILTSSNLNEMLFNIDVEFGRKPSISKKIEYTEVELLCINQVFAVIDEYKSFIKDGIKEDMLDNVVWDLNVLEQNKKYVSKMIEIVLTFAEELQRVKLNDNVFSFDDLLHYAAELLEKKPDIVSEYKSIFVDEYQDVNPIQEYIINKFIRDDSFVVGDVKQSIYAFRLADPTIFLDREQSYNDGAGVPIKFNSNYRSYSCILDFVNSIFNVVMTKDIADIDYEKDAQFKIDSSINKDGGNVSIHLFNDVKVSNETETTVKLYDIQNHIEKNKDIPGEVLEGKFIANEIKKLVNYEEIEDGKDDNGNQKYRYIQYSDIVLLFRNRNNKSKRIINIIKDAGLPIDEASFSENTSTAEREIMNFLRVIDNPIQDIPLAGFLLSFFGGYSEDELAKIVKNKNGSLYSKMLKTLADKSELSDKIKQTIDIIKKYRTKSSFKNVADLMSGIVSDYSYDAYLTKLGEQKVYELKSFISKAKDKNDVSLGRFIEEYSENSKSDVKCGGVNSIQVSTFHAYKGLEKPVVFICDVGCNFSDNEYKNDLISKGKGYIGIKYFDFVTKNKYKTLSYFGAKNIIKQNALKEEMRLFYVALTRAQKYMYVTASPCGNAKEIQLKFNPFITGIGSDLDFIAKANYYGTLNVDVKIHDDEEFDLKPIERKPIKLNEGDKTLIDKIRKIKDYKYQYDGSTKIQMKYSVTALDSINEPIISVYEETTNLGTSYHKVMQNIDFSSRTLEDVKNEFNRFIDENIFIKDDLDKLNPELIVKCLNSNIIEKAREAIASKDGQVYQEKRFMMYKPAKDVLIDLKEFEGIEDKILVQGVVDLFIMGKENIIVDFKYSRLQDEKQLEKYKTQLKLYKSAIESTICAKIDKLYLYSFITGEEIEIE